MNRETIDTLLDVQVHDTQLDQLRHQLSVLPARAERDQAAAQVAAIDRDTETRRGERDDLERQRRRLDDEVETLGAKRTAHDQTLYGGTVTNARELQDLQEEIEALGRRISVLEDQELELMEQLEPVDEALVALDRDRTDRSAELERATAALTEAEADLQGRLGETQRERDELAAAVPADLLQEYEHLRAGGGGVGIARLVGGNQCGGCHLTLSAVEVAAIRKHPDEITHCEECGRLLVP